VRIECGSAGVVQAPAKVRALQVGLPIAGGAVQLQMDEIVLVQLGGQCGAIQRQVHGIAGLGMGELKVQLRAGGQADAGTAESDARRRQLAQVLPGVVDGGRAVGHGYLGCLA